MSNNKVAVVMGIGPGLGSAVARRFAREGFALALMARSTDKLTPVKEQIESDGGTALSVPTDATNIDSVAEGFARVREQLGDPDVFVYNAGMFKMTTVADTSAEDFISSWQTNCLGGFLGAKQVLPAMIERGSGTMLFTGATAAMRGGARFSSVAAGKFGLRALAQSLARELGPQGIHVAHIIIDGMINTDWVKQMMPGREDHTLLDPNAIAESYWQLHAQNNTAWTQELDLRPAVEKF